MPRTPLADDTRLEGGAIENIIAVYEQATPAEIADGIRWYPVAGRIADSLHSRMRVGAGVLAALSPSTAWDINVAAAGEIIATGDTKWQSKANKTKALRILAGEEPLDVLGGNKVRAFYRTIAGDQTAPPVIDRHAFSIWLGRHASDVEAKVLGRVGAYDLVANAYNEAAEQVGIRPHELQAITWVVWRRMKGLK